MRFLFAFAILCVCCCPFVSVVLADEQSDYDYREAHGAANALWMSGLLADYNNETITEASLMRELWAERPAIMTSLFAYYGEFTLCFQIDLISAETNGVQGTDNGQRVFFDSSVYKDANGDVIEGYERAYNTAVRANASLNEAYDKVNPNNCACPVNNKCCYETLTSTTACKKSTGLRCCNTGSNVTMCTQTQGNNCP